MVILDDDAIEFRFPDHDPDACFSLDLQRTLRIPDTDRDYPLPAGLGRFPLRHVEDFASNLPVATVERGGVMLPMWQSEALWLNFKTRSCVDAFPVAIKIAAGKINAITGEDWRPGLHRNPQDYCVCPDQPWLDGFCVAPGIVRQFVAMPLGSGYTAEEQITGEAVWGGLQVSVTPLTPTAWRRWRKNEERRIAFWADSAAMRCSDSLVPMGFAAGGRMRQSIDEDPFALDDWDQGATQRIFVSVFDSLSWQRITGERPPQKAPSATLYAKVGLPWFEYYADRKKPVEGGTKLRALRSLAAMMRAKTGTHLPDSEDVDVGSPLKLGPKPGRGRPVRPGMVE